jgi:hypothetical protein
VRVLKVREKVPEYVSGLRSRLIGLIMRLIMGFMDRMLRYWEAL